MDLEEIMVGTYLCIVTDVVAHPCRKTHDGASVGMDFGLKTYGFIDALWCLMMDSTSDCGLPLCGHW